MQESSSKFVHRLVLLANNYSLSQLFTFLCGLFCQKICNLCQMYFLEFHNCTLICFLSYVSAFLFNLKNKKQRNDLGLKGLVCISIYMFWGSHKNKQHEIVWSQLHYWPLYLERSEGSVSPLHSADFICGIHYCRI